MSDLLIDNQTIAPTPASGKLAVFGESSTKRLVTRDDSGRTNVLSGAVRNWSTADVVATGADTYLTGSGLVVPVGLVLQVGVTFRWNFFMTKSAAGTAAPVWNIRVGTAGTTGDTARVTFTQVAAQTAVADTGWVEINGIIRSVGASGVLIAGLSLGHVLATTGFSTLGANVMQVLSGGFDTTVANLIVGVSVNPGASGVWTHQLISAEMLNI
jgi:hypothetical protein